ncbi:MAG TPA: NUDIX hydrolase [Dehalococcoidia bacterium]|nr:NUDIX hydrolase [Dehalococcoidia bacterium]
MSERWETLSSRIVYETPWMRVREDRLRQPSGASGMFSYIDKGPFAIVIPYDGERVHLVHQYRYPVGCRTWELPGGRGEASDLPSMAALELAEETGFIAGRLTDLGPIYLAPGTTSQLGRAFLAEDLQPGRQSLEATEEGLSVAAFTITQLEQLIQTEQLRDATSLAALMLWRLAR